VLPNAPPKSTPRKENPRNILKRPKKVKKARKQAKRFAFILLQKSQRKILVKDVKRI